MGRQAKLKATRRTLARAHVAEVRALHAAIEADPAKLAIATAELDAEGRQLVERDLPGQLARLIAGGWRDTARTVHDDGAGTWDHRRRGGTRIMHSVAREQDGEVWGHVSISHRDGSLPDWYETADAGRLLYPDLAGVIVVAPLTVHSSIAEVMHVWYRLTGGDVVPDFRRLGTV